jgi:putative Mn2+ efflux pump MntP
MAGLFTLGVIGLSLSVDAFAAAVGKGATGKRPNFIDALRIGFVFGLFEAITPAIGWLIGTALSDWISAIDHWVAFGLLAIVGGHMLWHASKSADEATSPEDAKHHSLTRIAFTALATSIDAMAVGVSLAVLDVDILTACLVIGTITTVVATIGVMLGKKAGPYLGRYADILGGAALISIGGFILYQHLSGNA